MTTVDYGKALNEYYERKHKGEKVSLYRSTYERVLPMEDNDA